MRCPQCDAQLLAVGAGLICAACGTRHKRPGKSAAAEPVESDTYDLEEQTEQPEPDPAQSGDEWASSSDVEDHHPEWSADESDESSPDEFDEPLRRERRSRPRKKSKRKTSSRGDSEASGKKKRDRTKSDGAFSPGLLIGGSLALVLLLGTGIVAAAWLAFTPAKPGDKPLQAGVPASGKDGAPAAAPVLPTLAGSAIVDKPQPDWPEFKPRVVEPAVVPASTSSKDLARLEYVAPKVVNDPKVPPLPPPPAIFKPTWQVAPDRTEAPGGDPWKLPKPIGVPVGHYGAPQIAPVMSDQRQPFAIFPPEDWDFDGFRLPRKREERPQAKPDFKFHVTDCRTGTSPGAFHWRTPVACSPRLSPDGRLLVGPERLTDLQLKQNSLAGPPSRRCLGVFKYESPKAQRWIEMPGDVGWVAFVDNARLLVQTFRPEPVLRLIEVGTGETLREIVLAGEAFPAPPAANVPVQLKPRYTENSDFYRAIHWNGDVSVNGRYAVLACTDGVRLFDLERGEQVGVFVGGEGRKPLLKDYLDVVFSPDGSEVWSLSSRLQVWNVADGRLKHDVPAAVPASQAEHNSSRGSGLFPGPVPGTMCINHPWYTSQYTDATKPELSRIVELSAGSVVGTLPYLTVWESPTQRMTATTAGRRPIPNEQPRTFVVEVGDIDHGKEAELVAKSGVEPRPPVEFVDRSKAKTVTPSPPVKWTPVPPHKLPDAPRSGNEPDTWNQFATWPTAFGTDEAAELTYRYVKAPRQRHEVYWTRADRKTGRALAAPQKLWSWLLTTPSDKDQPHFVPHRPLAALRPDGRKLALVDLNERGRIDIFEAEGGRTGGFILGDLQTHPDAIFWPRADRLFVLLNGSWIVLDPERGTAEMELAGNYSLPLDYVPGRPWFVTWAGTHADILDIGTGNCLARCSVDGARGAVQALAVSPSQQKLLAGFAQPFETGTAERRHGVAVWDLTTGKAETCNFGTIGEYRFDQISFEAAVWLTDELILAMASGLNGPYLNELIDLKLKHSIANVTSLPDEFRGQSAGSRPMRTTPDGRVWFTLFPKSYPTAGPDKPQPCADYGLWREVFVDGVDAGENRRFVDPERKIFDPRSLPFSVEVRLPRKADSEQLAASVARALHDISCPIGPGGWKCTLDVKMGNSPLVLKSRLGVPTVVPQLDSHYRMLAPDNTEVWKMDSSGNWSEGSKFFKSATEEIDTKNAPPGWVIVKRRVEFDFGDRDPRTAMEEEITEQLVKNGHSVFTSYIPLDLKLETPQARYRFPDKTGFRRTPDGDSKHNAQY